MTSARRDSFGGMEQGVEGIGEVVDGGGFEDDVADAEGFGGFLVFGADVAGGHE